MPISTASILKDGVIAVTGGSAKAFSSLGANLNEHIAVFDGVGMLDRSSASFKTRSPEPSASAPNGYTQARREVVLKFPKTLANTKLTSSVFKLSLGTDVEITAAEIDTIRGIVAQVIMDTDFDDYWRNLSTN